MTSTNGNLAAAPEDVQRIIGNATVIDTHNDTICAVVDENTWLPANDIGVPTSHQLDIPKMKAGGLDVAFFAAFTGGYKEAGRSNSRLLALINGLHWTAKNNAEQFGLATSVAEIEDVLQQGKSVGVPTIEGAYSLEEYNAAELLRQYYDLGIRAIALCWSRSNSLGEGVDQKYPDETVSQGQGLTELGARVVQEMNRLGMIVDVSHMNDETFWGVIEAARAPVMATHSNARALYEHPRNLTDEQIVALAKTGGVVQQNFFTHYLGPEDDRGLKKLIDHIDHVAKLVGVDHVGLGSDFDGARMPEEIPNASFYYRITEELVRRGYAEEDIVKILGGNTLRVMQKVQDLAQAGATAVTHELTITPEIAMGDSVDSKTPLVSARVDLAGSDPDKVQFRVIVDGIVHQPEYDSGAGTVSLQVLEPLAEKFHVVTFEGTVSGKVAGRQTRVFHVLEA